MSHGDTSVSIQQAIINQDTSHLALIATRHGDTSVAIQQAIINQDTSHLDLNTTRGHSVAIQQAIINQDTSHLDLNATRGHKRSYPTWFTEYYITLTRYLLQVQHANKKCSLYFEINSKNYIFAFLQMFSNSS